jgi:hypothetical protein
LGSKLTLLLHSIILNYEGGINVWVLIFNEGLNYDSINK